MLLNVAVPFLSSLVSCCGHVSFFCEPRGFDPLRTLNELGCRA